MNYIAKSHTSGNELSAPYYSQFKPKYNMRIESCEGYLSKGHNEVEKAEQVKELAGKNSRKNKSIS